MAKAKKGFRGLVYNLSTWERRSESGYTHVHVLWRSGRVHSLADRLEGAIGNKAGYGGGDATAAKVERETRELIEAGHTHYFHSDGSYGYGVHIRFQLYTEATADAPRQWCEPTIECDGRARDVLRTAEILKALKLGWESTPEQAIARLRKLARTIETIEAGDSGWVNVVKPEYKVADLECNDYGELKSAVAARAARDAREAV